MNIEQVNSYPAKKVRALFGMTTEALSHLLATILPELIRRRQSEQANRPDRKRGVGAGRLRRLKPYQEVLLTLIYLRHNVSQAVVGQLFGVSADTSENTFHEAVFVLRDLCPSNRFEAEKKWKKTEPSWTPEKIDHLLIDSFESPVRRPSRPDRQQRLYSGKKKRHTLKTQVVTEVSGEILDIEAGHRGSTADKRLYEASDVEQQYPNATKQGDLGYQGVEGMVVPNKKPKGGALSDEQKQENRKKAAVRVHVEHGIRRIKGWRILRDDYRIAIGLFPLIASTVVGLVQMVRIIH